jgi:hypothetical protein
MEIASAPAQGQRPSGCRRPEAALSLPAASEGGVEPHQIE